MKIPKTTGFLPLPLILAVGFTLFACLTPKETVKTYDSGTATVKDLGGDGDLYVTITMKEGLITDVVIHDGSLNPCHDYRSYGKTVIETAKGRILDAQNFDHIDVIAGATLTRKAIEKAGRLAVEKIKRGEFD